MDAPADLPFTGERFVPGTKGEIWIEHWHRYHFAARWAAGKRVLDVACGEGYGSAFLARSAAYVAGVDVSPQAIAHAERTYAKPGVVEFVQASCTRLPCGTPFGPARTASSSRSPRPILRSMPR